MDISLLQSQISSYQSYTADTVSKKLSALSSGSSTGTEGTMDEREKKEIMDACKSFESYFLHTLLREMRKTVPDQDSFIPKSHAEKVFIDMMDEEIAKSAAEAGGIGLAQSMFEQMTMSYSTSIPRQ